MVPHVLDFASKNIDQLLNDLDVIRSKKGELDTYEKKVVAVLWQKLADQEQRLRKHGLMPGDAPGCCTVPSAVSSSVPTASR